MYSLTSTWTIQRGKEKSAIAALRRLAQQVEQNEAGTLIYLVHVPDMTQPSLPTPSNLEVVFFEVYRDEQAFHEHVNGSIFQSFVAEYGSLFLSMAPIDCGDGKTVIKPFTTVEFLERKAGFIRPEVIEKRSR
ncbi:MAG TPA: antibiotic biosynthesis monooxygenase [Pyrinomonadaceae bacterium]